MDKDIAIKIEGVSKKYSIGKAKDGSLRGTLSNIFMSTSKVKDFWALKDISFDVKKGDVVGIIGKNGAGKSTLLKILSQITKPTEGKITIDGRIASLLEVGTGFHPELTGRENIYLNGTILGMTRKEVKSKFDEIVAFSGIEKFIDTPVKHYSSGMYVRLAFSVAAHLEPEILIIDEVLAVGDAEFQKKCLGKMQDVAGQGRTVLFVSHNLGSVRHLCNKGVLLMNGVVNYFGSIEQTIKKYQFNDHSTTEYLNESAKDTICLFSAGVINNIKSFDFEDEMSFFFKLNNTDLIDSDIRLLFRVKNKEEQIITTQEIRLEQHKKDYIYTFQKGLLMKGTYSVNTIIYTPAVIQYENIEDAFSFEILNNHRQFSHLETFNIGNFFIDANWS